jgi:hypothetical protein
MGKAFNALLNTTNPTVKTFWVLLIFVGSHVSADEVEYLRLRLQANEASISKDVAVRELINDGANG